MGDSVGSSDPVGSSGTTAKAITPKIAHKLVAGCACRFGVRGRFNAKNGAYSRRGLIEVHSKAEQLRKSS